MFCENGRSAIHVLNCEKCVKVRRRETTWDRRDSSPGSRAGREPRARGRGRPAAPAGPPALRLARFISRSSASRGGGRARERVPESVSQRKSPSAHLKLKQSTCSALHCLLAKLRVPGVGTTSTITNTPSNSKLNRSMCPKSASTRLCSSRGGSCVHSSMLAHFGFEFWEPNGGAMFGWHVKLK